MPPAPDVPAPANPAETPKAPAGKTSDAVLDRLTRLHPKVIDLTLERVERLLALLGHPEDRLAPVIHVAGTNGKGSLLAFLRAMLETAGRRVQVYTSPHLVRFHERIRLCEDLIGEDALIKLLEHCEAVNGPDPITFFEVTTAAAFLAFAEEAAGEEGTDVLLLETGLGGRLDATNVIARPRLTAITPVALDHQQFLGPDLEAITKEKAGILKAGVPCVVGPQEPAAIAVLEARAAELGAPLFVAGRDWTFEARPDGLRYSDGAGRLDLPKPVLPGVHQYANAAMAVACARQLEEFGLDREALAGGLRRAEWPGRLQRLSRGPLVEALPPDDGSGGWELWLDGGHNPAAGQMLAESLQDWRDRPFSLVYGMLDTKVAAGYLEALAPLTQELRAVRIPGEAASLSAEAAAGHATKAGIDAAPAASVLEAVRALTAKGGTPGRILICGSLYLAGQVLRDNG